MAFHILQIKQKIHMKLPQCNISPSTKQTKFLNSINTMLENKLLEKDIMYMMKWDMYLHKFNYLGNLKQLITLYLIQSINVKIY